jgi:glycosyltransferase involved in cell wall biosynthesis
LVRQVAIQMVLASATFDLVVSEGEGNAELIASCTDVPRIMMLQNTSSTLFRRIRGNYDMTWEDRLFYWPELLKIMRYEKTWYGRYDTAVVVSDLDQQVVRRRCPDLRVKVIPNGVDLEDFPYIGPKEVSHGIIAYVGNYGYPPNADAIIHFCREIFPLVKQQIANARLLVVGDSPPPELMQFDGVEVLGFVPDLTHPMRNVDVVIAPLRVGGGTRLKIIEALALGKPVVASTLGAEGLNVCHGHDILIADKPDDFAASVTHLLRQPELRAHLAKNGRRLVERDYSYDMLADQLEAVFHQTVADAA